MRDTEEISFPAIQVPAHNKLAYKKGVDSNIKSCDTIFGTPQSHKVSIFRLHTTRRRHPPTKTTPTQSTTECIVIPAQPHFLPMAVVADHGRACVALSGACFQSGSHSFVQWLTLLRSRNHTTQNLPISESIKRSHERDH